MQNNNNDNNISYELFKFKFQCAIFIFISATLGGLLPLKLKVKERLLSIGNVLSGGVFLAAGFTHMLAESVEGFEKLKLEGFFGKLPIPYILCMLGILITFILEKVIIGNHNHHFHLLPNHAINENELNKDKNIITDISRGIVKNISNNNSNNNNNNNTMTHTQVNAYVLAFLLSIHSIIEGIALGVEDTISDATNIFIAIIGHKIFAAFAFGVNLTKNNISTSRMVKLIAFFSFMTPFGILMGMGTFGNGNNNLFAEVIKGLSSGTFIYIALMEIILEEFENSKDKYIKCFFMILGALIMSSLSHHEHRTNE